MHIPAGAERTRVPARARAWQAREEEAAAAAEVEVPPQRVGLQPVQGAWPRAGEEAAG